MTMVILRSTIRMVKVAISLPDELFDRADALAERLGMARSRLYSAALTEYLDAHSADGVTEALDAVYADHGSSELAPDLVAAQADVLNEDTW